MCRTYAVRVPCVHRAHAALVQQHLEHVGRVAPQQRAHQVAAQLQRWHQVDTAARPRRAVSGGIGGGGGGSGGGGGGVVCDVGAQLVRVRLLAGG